MGMSRGGGGLGQSCPGKGAEGPSGRFVGEGVGARGGKGSSLVESGFPSSAARSVPLDATRPRSWDAPWGPLGRRTVQPIIVAIGPVLARAPPPGTPQPAYTYLSTTWMGVSGPSGPCSRLRAGSLWQQRELPSLSPEAPRNLPESLLTRLETRVPPCPALHTKLAPPESLSFLSPLPALSHLAGTAVHNVHPHPLSPFSGNHPPGKAPASPGLAS